MKNYIGKPELDIKFRFEEIGQSMKHILIPLLVVIFLMLPVSALALSGEASSQPEQMVKTQGKVQYRYNIQQVQRETAEGNVTVWTYDYVEVQPPATKAKVKQAIRDARSSKAGVADTVDEMTAAQQRLAAISEKSYAQITSYINNNVTDLASAKQYLKVLSKAVLAIIKQLDL